MLNSEFKNLKEIQFVPNSKNNIITLPLGGKILRGHLILTGTLTVAGGTTNGTVIGEGGPVNLIKRIYLHAIPQDGSRYPGGEIVDCTPRSLLRYSKVVKGRFLGELSGSTLGGGAAGVYNIYLGIPIFFQTEGLRKGKGKVQTALNADISAYKNLYLEIETGDLSTCFSGNDRSATSTFSTLKLQWMDERENFDGDTLCMFQEDHTVYIPTAQERLPDSALPPDGAFLEWLMLTEQSTAKTLADTILSKAVIQGGTIDWKQYANDIRQINYDDTNFDLDESAAGHFYFNFMDNPGGLIRGAIPAAGLLTQYQVLNPSGANLDDMLIFTRRIFQPVKYAPAAGPNAAKNN